MECNKDEAIRAKDLAEKEMKEKNFAGALQLALKANNLFPGLDGVTQLVEVLNIFAVLEKKVNGEVNWYAVLDADPSADEETLKKHYKILAFALHPDNNKSTGADKALKIVSEAWDLLSNKAERTKYDDKMRALWNYIDMSPPVPTACEAKPVETFSETTPVPPCPSGSNTFLTKCACCKKQHMYLILYCNKVVLCPECGEPFLAIDSSSSTTTLEEDEDIQDTDLDSNDVEAIDIPDSDFHDFGEDKTEDSFDKYQVWAAYDKEGMPRVYVWISNVISKIPFEVEINWLESTSNTKNLVAITSGDFSLGEPEVRKRLSVFSHKVNWRKGPRRAIRIFPRKGEVWALYKNWSPDWNEHTSSEVIRKYEMVEVLDDFYATQGGRVAPLLKVAGFNSVFQRLSGAGEIRSIPIQEIFRFSHQVPSHLLTGQEAANSPKDCWELDPAAMPSEANEA